MFPADSRVSAECFTQGGQHTIHAYLGFTDGSVMGLTFLDIGFQDFQMARLSSYLGMWHCFGIRREIRDGAFQKALRIWKGGIKRWPIPVPRTSLTQSEILNRRLPAPHPRECKIAFGSAEADDGLTEDEDSGAEC
ncbi:hypothetical protein B0H14DRAFT_3146994 [Mycena olivaceomarginata]|nr:hypothetical protein B0H14DRAFT_3146994 [Mycena olivaceomarginata]